MKLVDDGQKWQIVGDGNSQGGHGFEDCDALVGTSCYFRGSERVESVAELGGADRTEVSYLIQRENGQLAFFHATNKILRAVAKRIIDNHIKMTGGGDYMAVELELFGAGCMVSDGRKVSNVCGSMRRGAPRLDKLVVEFPDDSL